MLVLTRRTNQSIMIGDDVEVKILGVSGEKVRIGITAPAEVPVYREEVFERLTTEQAAATNGSGSSSGSNGAGEAPARNGASPDQPV